MINNEAINYTRKKKNNHLAILSLIEGGEATKEKKDQKRVSKSENYNHQLNAIDVHSTSASATSSPVKNYHGTSVLQWSH
jgi:hypothetical protein